MVTAQELIVAIRSEGVRDTVSDLRGVEDSMKDTAESTSEAADEAEGFSQQFKGAIGAAVAAFSIATAGFASQIPVLQETLSGLGAVFDALGLAASDLLRDLGVGGLTSVAFDVAAAINNTEGSTRDLAGAFGILTSIVAPFAGLLGLAKLKAIGVSTALGLAQGKILAAGSAVAKIVSGLGLLGGTLAALTVGIAAFALAYGLGLGDIQEKTDTFAAGVEQGFREFLQNIRQDLISLKEDAKGFATDTITDFVTGLKSADPEARFRDFLQNIRQGLLALKEDAVDFGANIVIGLARGIAQASVPSQVLDSIETATGVDLSIGDVPDFRDVATGDTGGSDTGRPEQTGNTPAGPIATTNQIDGKALSESTGRFRRGPTARNGGL